MSALRRNCLHLQLERVAQRRLYGQPGASWRAGFDLQNFHSRINWPLCGIGGRIGDVLKDLLNRRLDQPVINKGIASHDLSSVCKN